MGFSLKNIFRRKVRKEEEKHRAVYLVTDPALRTELLDYIRHELVTAVSIRSTLFDGNASVDRTVINLQKIFEGVHKHLRVSDIVKWTPNDAVQEGRGCFIGYCPPGISLYKDEVYITTTNPDYLDAKAYPDAHRYAAEIRAWENSVKGLQKVELSPFGYNDIGYGNYSLS